MAIPPTDPVAVQLAVLNERVGAVMRRLDSHSAQLESLKARRLPIGILTVAFAGVGSLASIAGFLVHR